MGKRIQFFHLVGGTNTYFTNPSPHNKCYALITGVCASVFTSIATWKIKAKADTDR